MSRGPMLRAYGAVLAASASAVVLAQTPAPAPVLAQTSAAAVDIARLGPQVGDQAIAFRLPDQHGREQTLESVAGPKGTMLVFFRSADW